MTRFALFVVLGTLTGAARLPAADRPLKVPDGFEVVPVAGPPLVRFPVSADFDDRGRLYVTDMAGPITREEVTAQKKAHRVVRLEDANGDGIFDKAVTFADGLAFPEGAMWLAGSLYVAAPPHIWKLTDTDDDGKADKREVWFDGKTLTGCANDLHGPFRGPDGYIYWAKGAFAKQEYTLPNGTKLTTRASHIFRAKPDGSGIEPVMTGGMDNPVDVVFTPGGERIFSTTFFQHPAAGRRDGLVHAVYGGIYGKDHDPLRDPDHKWTSPQLMPVLTHQGPSAPCGLHRYESDQFGPAYRDNLFCCQFNLRKVSRHVLVPKGSTFETTDSDFVSSDDVDFHPTDVLEDADGSLLVIDTGGWYKLCCPSSQLVKADVTGGIYRVRKKGSHKVEDPWGRDIKWEGDNPAQTPPWYVPSVYLGDLPAVKRAAIERWVALAVQPGNRAELARIARMEIERSGTRPPNPDRQSAILAVLTRVNDPVARELTRLWLVPENVDPDRLTTATHSAGLWRDTGAVPALRKLLSNRLPQVRRAAAEALGRIGDPAAVPDLLATLADERNDHPLDHSLTYSLIEIADPTATAAGLKHDSPRVKRAVLAALDQMPGGKLDMNTVLPHLTAADPAVRETAWWVAGRHPEWGDDLAGYFRRRLAEKLTTDEWSELADRMARVAASPAVQALLAEAVVAPRTALPANRAMSKSGLKTVPESWLTALTTVLRRNTGIDSVTIYTLRALPLKDPPRPLIDALLAFGRNDDEVPNLRLLALAVVAERVPLDDRLFDTLLLPGLADEKYPLVRAAALDAVDRVRFSPAQLSRLAAALPAARPTERPRLLDAFGKSKDEAAGLALVAALDTPAVRAAVRTEQVKPILDKYPAKVRAAAERLYAELDKARGNERERLESIYKELPPGDVRRGQVVFNGAKAACAACHKIGYVGGTIGPDLTKIGSLRTDRDLLDSVLFPSAAFVRGYESVKVSVADGRELTGILKVDAPGEVVLIVAADKEVRLPRADVEEVKPGTVSVMPAGLDQQLTKQELADLIAFLKACK